MPPARNPQLFDFGLPIEQFDDPLAVRRKIDEIEQHFDLVAVLERMDESLLLLRRMLSLDWDEILLLHTNEQRRPSRKAKNVDVSAGL